MLGRHVGRVSCRPASEPGGASKERVNPARTSGRQAEGEEEGEGQQTKRRKATEKGAERGKRRNTPNGPMTERTGADRTPTGGERLRGGKRRGSRAGGEREDQKTGRDARSARTQERRHWSRVCSVRCEREIPRSCVSGTNARVEPVPNDSLPPLGGLTTDLCEGELPAQNVFMNSDSPRRRSK